MRVGVTGGRENYDYFTVDRAIRDYVTNDDVVVHGAAAGIDSLCAFAVRSLWPDAVLEPHPADWKKHGKGAGPIRNAEMIASGLDKLLVFRGGSGTANMRYQAQRAGIPVVYIRVVDDSTLNT